MMNKNDVNKNDRYCLRSQFEFQKFLLTYAFKPGVGLKSDDFSL